jgi:hypothetical protein
MTLIPDHRQVRQLPSPRFIDTGKGIQVTVRFWPLAGSSTDVSHRDPFSCDACVVEGPLYGYQFFAAMPRNGNAPLATVMLALPFRVALESRVPGHYFAPTPLRTCQSLPGRKIRRTPPLCRGGIDGGGSADDLPAVGNCSPSQGTSLVVPVMSHSREIAGIQDVWRRLQWICIVRACFNQQYPDMVVLGEPGGNNATSRACTYDDVLKSSHASAGPRLRIALRAKRASYGTS